MKSKETPTNERKKYGHNKLKSQIKNVVRAIIEYPVGIYMFKVNNRGTRSRCEKCSKLNNKDNRTTPYYPEYSIN